MSTEDLKAPDGCSPGTGTGEDLAVDEVGAMGAWGVDTSVVLGDCEVWRNQDW